MTLRDTNQRKKTKQTLVFLIPLLLCTSVVQAYVNNNKPSDTKTRDLSTLPIQDPKILKSLQQASKLVTSKNDPTLIDATQSNHKNIDRTEGKVNNDVLSSTTIKRQRWGVDNVHENEYWFDSRIHSFGNIGFWGAFHAACAPFSTKLIDIVAYEGQDLRHMVADDLSKMVKSRKARIVDLCCGVGTSTRALHDAFPEAETVIGVDTSSEMISMAKFLSQHFNIVKPFAKRYLKFLIPLAERWFADNTVMDTDNGHTTKTSPTLNKSELITSAATAPTKKSINILKSISCPLPKNQKRIPTTFTCGNAESTPFPGQSFNLVTVMYAFHEAPMEGREKMLKEAHRLLEPGGTLAVVDINSDYKPKPAMLAGEPYVLEYQKNIHKQLRQLRGFSDPVYKDLVPDHVGMWILRRIAY